MSDNFDRHGSIISGATLFKTPSQMGGDIRPVPRPRAKTYEAVSSWQRREMVDVSRVIAAGVPTIRGALIQAGEFSVGDSWHVKYRGTDPAWGKKRDEWINTTFARHCNSRGRMNDWRSSLRQLNWTRKVQGDFGLIFDGQPSKDPLTGKEKDPTGKFHVVKFDRISTGLVGGWQYANKGIVDIGNGLEMVKELPRAWNYYWNYYSSVGGYNTWPGIYIINDPASPFDGQRIIDGVIVDANMRVLGYRITGFNDDGIPTYCDLPKAQMHFNFSAREDTDYLRGIPEIGSKIIPIMHLDDIQNLMEMAVKLASALAITRKSTDGRPAQGGLSYSNVVQTDEDGSTKVTTRAVQEIYPGIYELATNNKEGLEALQFNRPSMNEEGFIERIETAVLHDLWPRALIYGVDSKRAGTRALVMQARTICNWDQTCLERDARWICDLATEFAMRAGYIPGNDKLDDPYNYVFTVPGQFTVDEGNDLKMHLMSLGRCTISRGIICEMDGYLAEEIEEQREAEVDRTLAAAERLQKKHDQWSVKEIALMLDNSDSNVSFTDQNNVDTPAAEPVGEMEETPVGPDKKPGKSTPQKGEKK